MLEFTGYHQGITERGIHATKSNAGTRSTKRTSAPEQRCNNRTPRTMGHRRRHGRSRSHRPRQSGLGGIQGRTKCEPPAGQASLSMTQPEEQDSSQLPQIRRRKFQRLPDVLFLQIRIIPKQIPPVRIRRHSRHNPPHRKPHSTNTWLSIHPLCTTCNSVKHDPSRP